MDADVEAAAAVLLERYHRGEIGTAELMVRASNGCLTRSRVAVWCEWAYVHGHGAFVSMRIERLQVRGCTGHVEVDSGCDFLCSAVTSIGQ